MAEVRGSVRRRVSVALTASCTQTCLVTPTSNCSLPFIMTGQTGKRPESFRARTARLFSSLALWLFGSLALWLQGQSRGSRKVKLSQTCLSSAYLNFQPLEVFIPLTIAHVFVDSSSLGLSALERCSSGYPSSLPNCCSKSPEHPATHCHCFQACSQKSIHYVDVG